MRISQILIVCERLFACISELTRGPSHPVSPRWPLTPLLPG